MDMAGFQVKAKADVKRTKIGYVIYLVTSVEREK